MLQRSLYFLLFLSIILRTHPAFAGLLLRFEGKGPEGEKTPITFQLEGKKLRVENPSGGIMIFDGEQQKLWSIDTKQKSYSEITEADAARIKEMREKMEKQIKEQMGKMPPEQRMQMEELLEKTKPGSDAPRVLTFEPMEGTKKTSAGFSCKPHRVIEGGQPIEEICFIPWKESGLSLQDFQAFDAFEQFLRKIGADSKSQGRIFQDLKQSPGIPAHVAMVGQDKAPRREQELTALKHETIPASRFTLPEGLQKKQTSAGPGGASR
jgi:hypothetical protein